MKSAARVAICEGGSRSIYRESREGFGLKSTSDYESDPGVTFSAGAANEAIAAAEWFVSVVRKQLL
jgi:hypothetical protein